LRGSYAIVANDAGAYNTTTYYSKALRVMVGQMELPFLSWAKQVSLLIPGWETIYLSLSK